jgi:hypothetical protein
MASIAKLKTSLRRGPYQPLDRFSGASFATWGRNGAAIALRQFGAGPEFTRSAVVMGSWLASLTPALDVDRPSPFQLGSGNKGALWGETSLTARFKIKRDYYAGGLMLLLGLGAAMTGTGYKFGTLARMGPGFMPVVLGIVLAFLGLLIAATALGSSEDDDKRFLPDNPQWFGWACILGGPIAFIILGQYGGMIPAVFACVFICALGDKTGTYKSSAILAAGVTVFGVILFHYLLSIPFPLLRGVNL